ncbi:MAG: lipase [Clostridia bacterium]|nr:lipase [Clostridia bacterium]
MKLSLLLGRIFWTHPEKADPGRRKIACIGDSITFGAGVPTTRKTDAWPVLWQKRLGKDYQVLNYGVSGATLQKEGHFPYYKIGFLGRLDKASPEMIVLMLGTNDSKPFNWDRERFEKEYEAMVSELKSKPWAPKVVLMVPPKAFPEEKTGIIAFDTVDTVIHDSIRPFICSLGERLNLPVIDLYALTENHPEYFCDGVHPNVEGNRFIADIVYDRLKNEL